MEAQREDLVGLLHLQKIDLDLLQQKKRFEELPQRATIMNARKKLEAIAEKRDKVGALKKETLKRLTRIDDEDAALVRKAEDVQTAIEAAQGDYRNIEARTKELDGIAKRRATLVSERAKEDAALSKVNELESQVMHALEELGRAEKAAVESFQQEGGTLKMQIAQLEQQRAQIAASMTPAVVERYGKIAAHTGGVAVGVLNGAQCGVCRATLEGGRLIDLKGQAPLGICPACKRLLIVE